VGCDFFCFDCVRDASKSTIFHHCVWHLRVYYMEISSFFYIDGHFCFLIHPLFHSFLRF
jgi:hypothetical protein